MTEGEIHRFVVAETREALIRYGYEVAVGRKLRNGCVPDLIATAPPTVTVNVEIRTRLRPGDLEPIMTKYGLDGARVYIATSDYVGVDYILQVSGALDFPQSVGVIELNSDSNTIRLLKLTRLPSQKSERRQPSAR